MPSFDVVCKIEQHELSNALNQASKEIAQRYDFKGCDASIERTDDGIVIKANSEIRVDAARDVLHQKLAKRGVSLKAVDAQAKQPSGSMVKQLLKLKEGIEKDDAKKIVKAIKDAKLKVQASIQGDVVRVTGKKRDDLQEAIASLKAKNLDLPLTYTNFRD